MSKFTDFIIKEHDPKIWNAADKKARSLPILPGSHRGLAANQVGCLGEAIAVDWFISQNLTFEDQTNLTTHDYRISSEKLTIDIKTKDRTVEPRDNYECSVPEYNHAHQRPNYYIFVSLQRDSKYQGAANDIDRYSRGFILGGIDLESFDKRAVFWKKDEIDPTNGTKFWTSCFNVYINQLESITTLQAKWK
ncbi:hypothetical protein [Methylotenera sp. 1P/1]|uniref:hypothetical protein n=1 Tax=Methylotenera sp. 1P/1 TaxID=1131551 RepID=UPI00035DFD7C|nr:hypothetical protein [Methylotenera sp. 1P/1]